ncbi:MAG: helix-turn-helix domain-containing protein [Phycicoccus sp.]
MGTLHRLDHHRRTVPATPVTSAAPSTSTEPPDQADQPVTTPPPRRRTTGLGAQPSSAPEPLWRERVGRTLRVERAARGERIADVAGRAGVSPQYLSEVERGRKDASSEVLSALAGALGLSVAEVARQALTARVTIAPSGRPSSGRGPETRLLAA